MEEKTNYREELFYKQKNGYDLVSKEEVIEAEKYSEGYKEFLNDSRTEREAVINSIAIAEQNGFVKYSGPDCIKKGAKLYFNNRGKALTLAVIGEKPMSAGCVIVAAHVDSPKIDLKQVPLYEDSELAFFKTHYYGGIKKYQWTAIPLELHGVVALKNGEVIDVVIGREKGDPHFVITDLLPHLAADQMKKTMAEGITGEGLNVLIGSTPYDDEGEDRVKLAIMSVLAGNYGITEEDFVSAELSVVPAFEVTDIGFDRSLIGGYGQDDRVCAYAGLKALVDTKNPQRTCLCILADKEETGSQGVSGMQSMAFEWVISELCKAENSEVIDCLSRSVCISADVTAAFDPNYPEVTEKRNGAKLNYGIGLSKFSGARGKSGTSDSSAEFVAYIRNVYAKNNVIWQMCELGKVDQGGGGTVAAYMANRNIETLDAGVPVLSMHAPFEVVAKLDCYMTYKGILSVFEAEPYENKYF
ncbi:MAG: aminopeptidase [Ruminococcaceae bacterium]|nr:aminopeptidase [Oscillospiraceae bacterium]